MLPRKLRRVATSAQLGPAHLRTSLCRRPPRARLRRRTGCPPPPPRASPHARPTRPNRPSTSARTPQGDDLLTPISETPTPAKKVDKDPVFGDSVEDEVFSPLPAAHPTHRPDPAPFHQHTVECTVDASNGVCFARVWHRRSSDRASGRCSAPPSRAPRARCRRRRRRRPLLAVFHPYPLLRAH